MKRWIVLSLLFVPLLATAAGFWDGSAALQRGDADFESGLYATSNSFPPGTQITIQNEDTGKTVTATVTGRIEGQSGILVLLSPKTAQALDLPAGTLGRVRVTVPPKADSTASAQQGDQTVSTDPDVNPAAAYGGTDGTQVAAAPAAAAAAGAPTTETPTAETPTAETPTTEAPTAETPTAETPTAETPTAETPTAETPAVTQEAPAQEPQTAPQATASSPAAPSSPDADAAAILSAAESRSPQKQVFQPPREDEKFVYHPPAQTPTQTATTTTPAQQGTATITSVIGEPGVTPPSGASSDLALADVVAPEESRPEEIVSAGTAVPAPSPVPSIALASPDVIPEAPPTAVAQAPRQTEVVGPAAVPPAAKVPPKVALLAPEAPAGKTGQQAAPAAAATRPAAVTTVTTATSLPRATGTYFLQIAAYGNETPARELAAKLAPTYPALVLAPPGQGTTIFKVVIGPLNRAESGTLLTWFRYRGFPDAFLKQE